MVHRASSKGVSRRAPGGARKGAAPVALVLDADRYGGRWIATLKGHVVGSADTLVGVNSALDAKGFGSDVILTKVPRKGEFVL